MRLLRRIVGERRTGERMDTKDGGGDGYEGERVERMKERGWRE